MLDRARVDRGCSRALPLHHSCRGCRRLVRCARESRLGQVLQRGGVVAIGDDVRVVDDEGVDVVVSYDVRHHLLVLLLSARRSSALWLTVGCDRAACLFVRLVALENNFCAVVLLLFSGFAQVFGLALLQGLIVEVKNLGVLPRFNLLLLLGSFGASLSLRGLLVGVVIRTGAWFRWACRTFGCRSGVRINAPYFVTLGGSQTTLETRGFDPVMARNYLVPGHDDMVDQGTFAMQRYLVA